jgi:type IV secretory pathway VirB2 component (pilin)
MRESLRRLRGPWRLNDPRFERSTRRKRREDPACGSRPTYRKVSRIAVAATALLLIQATVLAQSPWERAASNLEQTFTGPLARSLALVAIVIGGLMFMFGEGGAKRQISGIVFGGGLALFAAQFLTWLF